MGRLVTDSFNGAMVMANLFEIDPDTKEPLDTFAVASELEALRGKYEDDKTGVHIIGFSKVMGDVRSGALNVITFLHHDRHRRYSSGSTRSRFCFRYCR